MFGRGDVAGPGRGEGIFGTLLVAACTLLTMLCVPATGAAAGFDALGGTDGCVYRGFTADGPAPSGCTVGEVDNYEAILAADDGRDVYVADDEGLVRRYVRDPATGALTTTAGDCWTGAGHAMCTPLLGIGYPTALAMSPDGRQLYVGNGDGVVAVLQRDPTTGLLSQLAPPDACYGPVDSTPTCTFARISWDWIMDVEVTPDGGSLLASSDDDSLTIFTRDLVTGELTQPAGYRACWGSWSTDGEGNPCQVPTEQTWTYMDAVVSPDSRHVYTAGYDELLHFERDPATNELTLRDCYTSWVHEGCVVVDRSTYWDVQSLALSPDGSTLYAVGWDQLLTLDVDAATGSLTNKAGTSGCMQREDRHDDASCAPVRGYDSGNFIDVAPDGSTAYVTTYYGSMVVFDRDAAGVLTQRAGRAGCITASPRATTTSCLVTGESSPSWQLAVSPDSANVYVLSGASAILAYGSPSASCRDVSTAERRNTEPFTIQARCVGLDPDLRTIEIVTPPAHASIVVEPNGVLRVTPDAGWSGAESFTYRATDGVTSTAASTGTFSTRAPSPPVAVSDPTLTGSPTVGATLTVGAGTFTQPLTPVYDGTYVERCDATASTCTTVGSVATTYRIRLEDLGTYLRATSWARNADGQAERSSTVLGPVVDATGPTNRWAPAIAGTQRVSQLLELRVGWESSQALTTTWSWERCDSTLATCATIAGATAATYRAQAADEGSRLRASSTASDSRDTATVVAATSGVIGPAYAPYRHLNRNPVITGTPLTDETLTVTPALLNDGSAADVDELEWRRCRDDGTTCEAVPGATGTTYVLTAADNGTTLMVFQRSHFSGRTDWALSTPSAEIREAAQVGTMPPILSTPPSVDGTAAVDRTLVADEGSWDGVDPFTYAFQWLRCDAAGANCTPTSSTSALQRVEFADVGATFRVTVTATNADGTASATSAASAAVPEPVPKQQWPYSSVGSLIDEGRTITATMGSWRSVSAVTATRHEFYHCGSSASIPPVADCTLIADGASATTTLPAAAVDRYLRWRVHVANAVGSATSMWLVDGPVRPGIPVNTATASVSGSATIGSTLTATPGTWTASRPITTTMEWQRCLPDGSACGGIGVTTPTYVVQAADEYRTLRVVERSFAQGVVRSFDSSLVASGTTGVVPLEAPHSTGSISYSGERAVGRWLHAQVPGTYWSSPAAMTTSLRWQRCDAAGTTCADIPGETNTSYATVAADVDQRIRLVSTTTNAAGTTERTSNADVILPPLPQFSYWSAPTVAGSFVEGGTLTATSGSYTSLGATTSSWQWLRCASSSSDCTEVAGATASTYVLTTADIGAFPQVRQTATNAAGSASQMSHSSSRTTGTRATVSGTPQVTGSPRTGATLTASATWNSTTPVTSSFRWEACIADDLQRCTWLGWGTELVVPHEAVNRRILLVAEATNAGGSSTAVAAPTAVVVGAPQQSNQPLLSGAAIIRGTLTAQAAYTGTAPMSVSYAWLRCDASGAACAAIVGATGATYEPVLADLQRVVQARVTVANAYGRDTKTTNGLRITGNGPVLSGVGRITGELRVGAIVTYARASWTDAATTSTTWERCARPSTDCVAVGSRDVDSYLVAPADEHGYLRVVERAVNEAGTATSIVTTYEPIRIDPDAIPAIGVRAAAVTRGRVATFRWSRPADASTRVEYETITGSPRSGFGSRSRFVAGTGTSHATGIRAGYTTCLRIRPVTPRGAGSWSPWRCTTSPLTARSLRASRGWRTIRTTRFTRSRGAVLTVASRSRVSRIAVMVRRCPTCGTIQVEHGTTRVATVNLRGRARVVTVLLPRLARPSSGTVRLRVTSTRRNVHVYGTAMLLEP